MTRKESNIEFYSDKECAGHLTQSLNQNSIFLSIYLFVKGRGGERRRVCKQEKEQRKREKEYQVDSTLSVETDTVDLMTLRS